MRVKRSYSDRFLETGLRSSEMRALTGANLDLDGDYRLGNHLGVGSREAEARRHDLISIAVDDPLERELPDVGLVEMLDTETRAIRVVDTSDAGLRERFRADQAARRDRRRQMMIRNGAGFIELRTDRPYANELVRFFRARAIRRR